MNEGNQETSAGITPARRLGGLLAYRWTLTFEKTGLSPCALNTQMKNFRVKENAARASENLLRTSKSAQISTNQL
jgi:hypothetical protein